MIYGTAPGKMVNQNTAMVRDFKKTLTNRFDKRTLLVEIPSALDNMRGRDANFEMVISNTIQPLKMLYQYKIVKYKIAYIFWNKEYNNDA